MRRLHSLIFVLALIWGLILSPMFGSAQSPEALLEAVRHDATELSSAEMAGRGYQADGHLKAAKYIEEAFKSAGLKGLPGQENAEHPFFHPFSFGLNRIDSAEVSLNGERLEIGKDYIIHPGSGGHEAKGKVKIAGHGLPYEYPPINNHIVLVEDGLPKKVKRKEELKKKYKGFNNVLQKANVATQVNADALLITKDKLTYGLSQMPIEIPVVELLRDSLPKKLKKITSAEILLLREFTKVKSQNVIGWIEGKEYPDSFILVSAHYDHLGKMGDAIFYGANDNASGTAMLISMAEHYAKPENQPKYSMVFIGFGGEEVGLLGSRHYVERAPAFPLASTRFILNLDLMGNGDEGIVAVAGREFKKEFQILSDLNEQSGAVPLVKPRRNVPNSDHYFFVVKGVPGFFIYTLGGPPHYHDVYDRAEELRFSKYVEVRQLLIDFLGTF